MRPALRRWGGVPEAADGPSVGGAALAEAILARRGIDEVGIARLLRGDDEHHDPVLLRGMPEAVIAIGVAVASGTRIAIYGDYDADGVTACAMLTLALRAAGADVIPYIPNRMSEGYGLHAPALVDLAERGVGLVVSVDCGTSAVDVARGRPAGMRMVITDHHLAPAPDGVIRLPDVDALVNPKQPGETYPFDALAGAGVAWKLLEALEAEAVVPRGQADASLALAALGTIADMMPLRGENRTIVRRGLAQLAGDPPPGLRALLDVAGVRGAPRAADLAFGLGPRLNAAGRMEDAELALRLCLAPDADAAIPLAQQLQTQNLARQQAVARAMAAAESRVAALPDDLPAIVLSDADWPMGIVGLVAGRLAERYARPTFVVSLEGEEGKGSARSVRGVHLVQALDAAAPALLRYGGHAAAAGFSVAPERLDEFAELVSAAVSTQLGGSARERLFHVDAAVQLNAIGLGLCQELSVLEPCGQGNHEPLLAVRGCVVLGASAFGSDNQHVRVRLGDAAGTVDIEAVAFNKPGLGDHLPVGRRIDALVGLDVDRWRGEERVRLRLKDLRPTRSVLPRDVDAEPPLGMSATREPVGAAAST